MFNVCTDRHPRLLRTPRLKLVILLGYRLCHYTPASSPASARADIRRAITAWALEPRSPQAGPDEFARDTSFGFAVVEGSLRRLRRRPNVAKQLRCDALKAYLCHLRATPTARTPVSSHKRSRNFLLGRK